MNKKKLVLVLIFPLFLILALLLIFYRLKSNSDLVNSANFKGATEKKISGNKVSVKTAQGEVYINNVFKKDRVIYNSIGDPQKIQIKKSNKFEVSYEYDGDKFTIFLLSQPITQVRNEAENDFINALGINKDDACKLDVFLYIPISIDKNLGGDDKISYGLSWCPGAFVIEE